MLSAEEKRFKRYWEDQRSGGKRYYVILYTITWAFILFFVPLIISLFKIDIVGFFGLYKIPIWGVILITTSVSFAGSNHFWEKNERRWRLLKDKEAKTDYSIY
jgi:hypothetical protein